MSRSITEELVTKAIKTLKARGEKVTVRSVRSEIGHGSFSTISEHLKAADADAAITPLEHKDALFDQLRSRLYEISYDEAREVVMQEMAEDRRKLDLDRVALESMDRVRVLEAERAKQEALQRADDLEGKLRDAEISFRSDIHAILLENRELAAKLEATKAEVTDLKARLDNTAERYDQLARSLARQKKKATT